MAGSAVVTWDDALTRYDFGPGHPFDPVRLRLTMALASELGVLASPAVTMVSPSPATDGSLATVHDEDYIEAVRRAGRTLAPALRYGLGTADDPVFEGMHEAAALVVGATTSAARSVWSGEAVHAVSVAGGHHHAMRASASGFCVYNDLAVAIRWLLAAGAERVAYVDLDVHHGDGVQAAFYDDPRVLTISLHEHPATLFPGTGLPGETGAGAGEGYAVNVALPAGTGGRRMAARHRRGRGAVAARLQADGARQPARVRRPPSRSARQPAADHRRPAAGRGHDARPGARAVRGPLAGDRRRRVRAGPGGAEGLDASARDRGGNADRSGNGDPGPVAGTRAVAGGRNGAAVDDRRSGCPLCCIFVRCGSRRSGRSRDHENPECGVSGARATSAVIFRRAASVAPRHARDVLLSAFCRESTGVRRDAGLLEPLG